MIPLHEPFFDSVEEACVIEALRTGWVSTAGPAVDTFEGMVAQQFGARNAFLTASGTSAIHLVFEALKRKFCVSSGAFEVLVPNLSFVGTANGVIHAGGHPVFVDCALESMNLCVDRISEILDSDYSLDLSIGLPRSKISGRILLAVFPVHLLGWTTNLDRLLEVCRESKVPIVEDAAEAFGSRRLDGQRLGVKGLVSVVSFNGNKIITTGAGGAILSDDSDFLSLVRHLGTTAKSDGLRFVHDDIGFNLRMNNLQAAVGIGQMGKLPEYLKAKARITKVYRQKLTGTRSSYVYDDKYNLSNNWINVLVCNSESHREKILAEMLDEGIGCRPLWTPFHRQPCYKPWVTGECFPNSDSYWRRSLMLPSSPKLKFDDQVKVLSIVERAHHEGKSWQSTPLAGKHP